VHVFLLESNSYRKEDVLKSLKNEKKSKKALYLQKKSKNHIENLKY